MIAVTRKITLRLCALQLVLALFIKSVDIYQLYSARYTLWYSLEGKADGMYHDVN